ncbi:hypothetical protein A2188_00300 [Candidatus Woesebacteria bacterium RIFOXYA1_FULL_43_9]|uniref:Uncharacterized protein n=1 Tax=Candidatus Woesebacteria bacterium RIFOXYA1_FULL_43_9 TaxID=1802534 RepID=A0A1F8CJD1_9BACT|nr:MAG: hypothetical protein A2188_00300 [Candidatus Woesebacteria bacterium RIFOXYA1_FULL_43_9]
MESRKHKQIANKIARIKGAEYHSDRGVDIRTDNQAIEIEIDPKAFGHAKQQLAGSTRTPYLAVPRPLVNEALNATRGTRFGVMDDNAKIIKSGRKKTS